jgi:site-specific DNA-cytosine methylase
MVPRVYRVEAKVLRAQDHGTPQRRHRLVILGVRRELNIHVALHPPPTHPTPMTAGAALAARSPPQGAVLTGKTLHCGVVIDVIAQPHALRAHR